MTRLCGEHAKDFISRLGADFLNYEYRTEGFYCECADSKPYRTGIDKPYSKDYLAYLANPDLPRD